MINSAATQDLNVEIDANPISNMARADNTTARGGATTTIHIVYQKRIYKSRLIFVVSEFAYSLDESSSGVSFGREGRSRCLKFLFISVLRVGA